jgi:hypothetical protein
MSNERRRVTCVVQDRRRNSRTRVFEIGRTLSYLSELLQCGAVALQAGTWTEPRLVRFGECDSGGYRVLQPCNRPISRPPIAAFPVSNFAVVGPTFEEFNLRSRAPARQDKLQKSGEAGPVPTKGLKV